MNFVTQQGGGDMTSWRGPQQYSTVQYRNCGRVSQTSALASERSLFMRVPRGPSNVPQSLRSGKAILSGGDGWLGGDLVNQTARRCVGRGAGRR